MDSGGTRVLVHQTSTDSKEHANPDDKRTREFWTHDPEALMRRLGFGEPNNGIPIPSSSPNAQDVHSQARLLAEKIFRDWKVLNAIVERHEATIQKRWLKRTQEKRKKVLLEAWPNMATMHRPDLLAYASKPKGQPDDSARREVYLWPYINLEDLLRGKLFLLFLNSRGRNKPGAFAAADLEATHLGQMSRAIKPAFLNLHTMMFTGRDSPDTYGELVSWTDNPDASDWLYTKRGVHPGHGLMILEIQERLYRFLLDCCKILLVDMSEDALTGVNVPIQPEPPSVAGNETEFASLAAAADEAPYRLPAKLDLDRLESLLAAKVVAAEDQIWAMREDPGYFADIILDWRDHRQERILDINGHKHPILDNRRREPHLWKCIIENCIKNQFVNLEVWASFHEQIVRLQRLKEKYANEITPEKDLPQEYAMAFYQLDYHIRQFLKGPINALEAGFIASPPIRPFFVRLPQDPSDRIIQVSNQRRVARDKDTNGLIWVFLMIFDETQRALAGLNQLVDLLERVMEKDKKIKELITSWVMDRISNLSIFSQCLHQIELYQPWASTFETAALKHQDEVTVEFRNTERSLRPYLTADFGGTVTSLGNPSSGKFDYPVDKCRTRANTEAMIQAEKHLDKFWQAVDRELCRCGGVTPRLARLLSERILHRTTPEWVEPVKGSSSIPEPTTTTMVDDTSMKPPPPLSDFQFPLSSSSTECCTINREDQHPPAPKREKVKTKPPSPLRSSDGDADVDVDADAHEEPTTAEEGEEQDHHHHHQPTFRVDKRAHRVFHILFYTPSPSSQPGELAWKDFLHAMASIGFQAEKLYGSAWQFHPTSRLLLLPLHVEHGIQFHEPHLGAKIGFRVARRFGRRLMRAYGWHGGMFVPDESKQSKAEQVKSNQ